MLVDGEFPARAAVHADRRGSERGDRFSPLAHLGDRSRSDLQVERVRLLIDQLEGRSQQVFGMSAIGISMAMLATYLGFTAGNLLAVRQVRRAGVDRLIAWGFAFGFGGTLLFVAVASQPVLWWMLAAVAIFVIVAFVVFFIAVL